jgi:hypothetical protein
VRAASALYLPVFTAIIKYIEEGLVEVEEEQLLQPSLIYPAVPKYVMVHGLRYSRSSVVV